MSLEGNTKTDEKSFEKRYEELVQALPDIVYEIDVNGVFTFINQSVSALGYSPKELIGKHYSTLLHDDGISLIDRESVLDDYRGIKTGNALSPKLFNERRSQKRMTNDLEVRLKRKTGSSSMGDIIGSVISYGEVSAAGEYCSTDGGQFRGSVGIIRDVTMRRKSEDMLRKLYQAIDQFNSCVLILNRDFNIEYVNPAFFLLTGFVPLEVIGQKVFKYFSFEQSNVDIVSKRILDGFDIKDDVIVKRSESGSFWGELSISPVRSPNGLITHSIVILEDISLRKTMDNLLQNAWNEKEEAKRKQSILVESMTNDVKSAVMSILDSASSLSSLKNSKIENIQKEAKEVLDILDNMVASVSIDNHPKIVKGNTVSLLLLMERVCSVLRAKAEAKGLSISVKPFDDTNIECNQERLSRTIIALINNSIKNTESGRIEISVEVRNVDGNVPHLSINIFDTGYYIPVINSQYDDVNSIYVDFTLAKIIAKSIGGEIRNSSTVTNGNNYSLIVPVGIPEKKDDNSCNKYSVLVVDDNEVNLEFMRTLIENFGYRVLCASSAAEAIKILESRYVDAGIFDIQMPICNGLELAKTLRSYSGTRYSRSMPIFAMTAHDASLIENEKDVFNGVFPKPTDIKKLVDVLNEALITRETQGLDLTDNQIANSATVDKLWMDVCSSIGCLNQAMNKSNAMNIDIHTEANKLAKVFRRYSCQFGQELVELFVEHYLDEDPEVIKNLLDRMLAMLERLTGKKFE